MLGTNNCQVEFLALFLILIVICLLFGSILDTYSDASVFLSTSFPIFMVVYLFFCSILNIYGNVVVL